MYMNSLCRYVKQDKLLYSELLHKIETTTLDSSITAQPKFDEQFYLQDNSDYYYNGLEICINRCWRISPVWDINIMLDRIKSTDFPTSMALTTMQNLLYALAMIHSVTIIDDYVYFSGN